MTYVPLHNHTQYSLLDGLSGVSELVNEVAKLGLSAVSITDHGSLGGAYKLYSECKRLGIKPIIGEECYDAPASRTDKRPTFFGTPEQRSDDVGGVGKHTHITVFATSNEGLRNLYGLHSDSYERGFYNKPRVDLESLARYEEGLVCTTGCVGGTVATRLRLGQYGEARKYLSNLKDIFGDRLYVEVMRHDIEIEKSVERDLLRLSEELRVPPVATLDSHYTFASQSDIHDSLLCVKTKKLKATPKADRYAFDGENYFLQTPEAFERIFRDLPVSIKSTRDIADRVGPYDDIMDGAVKLPTFGDNDDEELRIRVHQWLRSRGVGSEYRDRIGYELEILISRGLAGYFLVTAHIMREGRKDGIRYGPGRGSAGGSLVAYALGITEIDPILHGLLFERFINPEREGLPDIDVDIPQNRRQDHIDMVRRLYGDSRVCQISTFGTIGAKNAIRDTVRINGLPFALGSEITRTLPPPKAGREPSLAELPSGVAPKEVLETARGLEGVIRSQGVHPGALIVSPVQLDTVIPIIRPGGKGAPTTSFDMNDVEKLGLLKGDWLGLATLGTIDECLRLLNGIHTED